jgi:4-hydroxybenzoate polyprenyltransferase
MKKSVKDTNYNYNSQSGYGLLVELLKGILYSSVFISLCAFALTVETYLLANLPVSLPMAVFILLATLFTYNLSSIQSEIRKQEPKFADPDSWWYQHKRLLAIVGVLSIVLATIVYLYFELRLNFWFVLHLAIISVGYSVPVVYRKRSVKPLRRVPLLKVFLIAYVWAMVTALFPLMDAGVYILDAQALLLFLRRFMFILSLALLFDIRDYTYDRHTNTLTVPGLIGVNFTKLLSLGLLTVYSLLVVATETGSTEIALLVAAAMAATVVWFSSELKPRLYFMLLADGVMLLHAALVYFVKA